MACMGSPFRGDLRLPALVPSRHVRPGSVGRCVGAGDGGLPRDDAAVEKTRQPAADADP